MKDAVSGAKRSGSLAAMWTIPIRTVKRPPAGHTNLIGPGRWHRGCRGPETIGRLSAVVTEKKRFAPLDPQQGNKEQAQIMVHPGGIGPVHAAGRATLRIFVHPPGFWLYAGNQKHAIGYGNIPYSVFVLRRSRFQSRWNRDDRGWKSLLRHFYLFAHSCKNRQVPLGGCKHGLYCIKKSSIVNIQNMVSGVPNGRQQPRS